jgi:serine protease Do
MAQDQGGQNLTQQTQQQIPQLLPSLAPIVQKVLPAVVNISVTTKGVDVPRDNEDAMPGAAPGPGDSSPLQNYPRTPFDEFLRRFFQGPDGQQEPRIGKRVALGSGFIIDPQGYVVTNNHVVGEGGGTVTVIFQDNTKNPAKIIGRDPKTDLALIKIETNKPLPYVTWGDSDGAKVGDWVIAVGNPFGLGGTVTTGIVSARGRDIHSGPFDDFLQLDAPMNRGNSGGPTFNMQAQVIGINTAIYSPSGGSVGIGFAIPANLAKSVVSQLREHGSVERAWLGVQIQEISPEIAGSLGLTSTRGALVADVTPNSPAAKAGIKQGDVVLRYNNRDVDQQRDLPRLVAETPVGSTAPITVWRNGRTEQLQATVGKMPGAEVASAEQDQTAQPATPERTSTLGLQLERLDNGMRQRLGIKGDIKGVVVTEVAQDSPAADLGIQPGDVIVAINQQPVTSPTDAAEKVRQAQQSGDKHLLLLLNRRGVNEYVGMSLG